MSVCIPIVHSAGSRLTLHSALGVQCAAGLALMLIISRPQLSSLGLHHRVSGIVIGKLVGL